VTKVSALIEVVFHHYGVRACFALYSFPHSKPCKFVRWPNLMDLALIIMVLDVSYTYSDNSLGKWEIPLTSGLQLRVVLGGVCAGTFRALVETPIEYAKVSLFDRMNSI
jgi:hypothetical protein